MSKSRPRKAQDKEQRHRTIAPRLAGGGHREAIGHGLPPEIKEGLKMIARMENQSVSWVLEKIIIKYFGFDMPEYVRRKKLDEKDIVKSGARVIPYWNGNKFIA